MSASAKAWLAAAAMLAGLPAAAAEDSAAPVKSSPPVAYAKCAGVSSVPLTADAEQSLPLQTVGALACGQMVAVLSDSEGYTEHIRTADGKDGYVARIYLTAERPVSPVMNSQPSEAVASSNGIYRWQAGAPGCEEFLSHGRHAESITVNGLTVQVSLQDTGWKYRVNVAVSNQSSESVNVFPSLITLDELQPAVRSLPADDAAKLAHATGYQIHWTAATASPSPSAATVQLIHRSVAERLAYRSSPAPDLLDAKMVLDSPRPGFLERADAPSAEALALKSTELAPAQKTAGVLWFERDPNSRELSLRVPVGDQVFDFSFAFPKN